MDHHLNPSVRHVLGLSVGTARLYAAVAHPGTGAPYRIELVPLPGADPDGSLATAFTRDSDGRMIAQGRQALASARHPGREIESEFVLAAGQDPEDLSTVGRAPGTRLCTKPDCLQPGWPWPATTRFCGFCGAPTVAGDDPAAPLFRQESEAARAAIETLLSGLRVSLERGLGGALSDPGWAVAVAVPAGWGTATRSRFRETVERALRAEVRLVDEDEATVLGAFLGAADLPEQARTLVVDFGAGRIALSLLKVENRYGYVRCERQGLYAEHGGGAALDLALAHRCATSLGAAIAPEDAPRWRLTARELKEALSHRAAEGWGDAAKTAFPVRTANGAVRYEEVSVTPEEFDAEVGGLSRGLEDLITRGLRTLRIAPQELDLVIVAGGGSAWPFVPDVLRRTFSRARLLNPHVPGTLGAKGALLSLLGRLPQNAASEPETEPEPAFVPLPAPEPVGSFEPTPSPAALEPPLEAPAFAPLSHAPEVRKPALPASPAAFRSTPPSHPSRGGLWIALAVVLAILVLVVAVLGHTMRRSHQTASRRTAQTDASNTVASGFQRKKARDYADAELDFTWALRIDPSSIAARQALDDLRRRNAAWRAPSR